MATDTVDTGVAVTLLRRDTWEEIVATDTRAMASCEVFQCWRCTLDCTWSCAHHFGTGEGEFSGGCSGGQPTDVTSNSGTALPLTAVGDHRSHQTVPTPNRESATSPCKTPPSQPIELLSYQSIVQRLWRFPQRT